MPATFSPYSLCSPCAYASSLRCHSQWSTHRSPVALCLGRREANPSLPTTIDWDLGGFPHGHAAPVWEVSLASATSSTLEALPACCGTLPASWPEESESPVFMTGILWTGFSAWPLSLWLSEAATAHHHAFIKGKRLMVKWAEHEIHSEKTSST